MGILDDELGIDPFDGGSSGPDSEPLFALDRELAGYDFEDGAEEDSGDFLRGVSTTFKQVPQLLRGVEAGIGAAGEKLFGEGGDWTNIKKAGVAGYLDWSERIAKDAKLSDNLDYSWGRAKDGDLGALIDWLQYGAGYTVGQGAQILATGGAGSLIGKTALKGGVENLAAGMVKKEMATLAGSKLAGGLAAEELAKLAVSNVASKIGQTTTMALTATGMEGGEIFGGLVSGTEKEGRTPTGSELALAFGSTLAAGGLEFVGDKLGLDLMLGKSKVFSPAKTMTGVAGRAGRAGLGMAAAAPVEAGTEYAQTMLEEFGQGRDPWSEESRRQAFNAAGLGGLGGAMIGGGGGLLSPADIKTALDDSGRLLDEADALDETDMPTVDDVFAAHDKRTTAAGIMDIIERPTPEIDTVGEVLGDDLPIDQPGMSRVEQVDPISPLVRQWDEFIQRREQKKAEAVDLMPEELRPVIGTIERQLSEGETGIRFQKEDGSWDGVKSTNPDWIKKPALEKYDQVNGTSLAKRLNKLSLKATISKVRQGKELSIGQEEIWEYVQDVARTTADPEVAAASEYTRIEKEEGIELEAPHKVVVADLNDGDKVVVHKNGIPDVVTVKGRDDDGNVVLEDGNVFRLDDFDKLEISGIKRAQEVQPKATEVIEDPKSIASGQEVNTSPSESMKEAGNYKKAHVAVDGLDISIENPVGSVRSGKDKNGREWSQEIKADYGYIKGTVGHDKDHVDIFVKPGYQGGAKTVHVVNQVDPETGKFDEHKVVLGAGSAGEAMETYLANYEPGWAGGKNVVEMSTDQFKEWAKSGQAKRGELPGNEQITPSISQPKTTNEPTKQPVNLPQESPAAPPIEQQGAGQPETPSPVVPASKEPWQMSKDEWASAIESGKPGAFATSRQEDWGSLRGQGKRSGSMVKGSMRDSTLQGKRNYTDIVGKLPKEERADVYATLGDENHVLTQYAKARSGGLNHEAAILHAISVTDKDVDAHKRVVELAISAGKPVPQAILDSYPDLQRREPAESKPEPATTQGASNGQEGQGKGELLKEEKPSTKAAPAFPISKHGSAAILVSGNPDDIKAKLAGAGIKAKGRVKKGRGMLFPVGMEGEIRGALEKEADKTAGTLTNEDGTPLVVYRGDSLSPGSLKPSTGGDLGTGIYLTEDRSTAEYFTDGTDESHTKAYNIKMGNPFGLMSKALPKSKGWKAMMRTVPEGLNRDNLRKWAKNELDIKNTYGFLARSFGLTPDTFNAFLEKHGFDGIISQGTRGVSEYSREYVVFSPDQVVAVQDDSVQRDTDGVDTVEPAEVDAAATTFDNAAEGDIISEGGIEYEISEIRSPASGKHRAGGSAIPGQLALFENKEMPKGKRQKFIESYPAKIGTFYSDFKKIENAEQAAQLVSPISFRSQETFAVIALDAEKRPISVLQHSVGTNIRSQVAPGLAVGSILNTKGVDSVWLVHNHPSGNATKSDDDTRLTRHFENGTRGLGVTVVGHVIVTPNGEASELDNLGNFIRTFSITEKSGKNNPVKVTDRRLKGDKHEYLGGEEISSSQEARETLDKYSQGRPGILLLNPQNRPIRFFSLPVSKMELLREDGKRGVAAELYRYFDKRNAVAAAIVSFGRNGRYPRAEQNISNFLRQAGVTLLDIIANGNSLADLGEIRNLASRGDYEGNPFYSKSTVGTTDTTPEQVTAELRDFLGQGERNLSRAGKLEIVRTGMGLPEAVRRGALFMTAWHVIPSTFFANRVGDSPQVKSLPDAVITDAKLLANFVNTHAFIKKGLDGFDVPTQKAQLGRVLRLIENDEIRKSVVESIPVDMMDMLAGKELTPEVLLHDVSVFRDLLSVDGDNFVALPVDVASRLANIVAIAGAKNSVLSRFYVGTTSLKGAPADGANTGAPSLSALDRAVEDLDPSGPFIGDALNGSALRAGTFNHADTSLFDDNNIIPKNEIIATSKIFSDEDVQITALYSKDGSIVGAYYQGKIYLVADRMKPGDAKYVMIHEGAHALLKEDPLFSDQKGRILGRFVSLKGKSAAVDAAYSRAEKAKGRVGTLNEEALAYFLQEKANHKHSIFRRIVAAIKSALVRLGVPVDKLNFQEADFVALFVGGVKRFARNVQVEQGEFAGEAEASYSKDGKPVQRVTPEMLQSPEFKKWQGDSAIKDVVWHGTDSKGFLQDGSWTFDSTKGKSKHHSPLAGLGNFFALDRTEAAGYGSRGVVRPFYVSVENPLRLNSYDSRLNNLNTREEAAAFAKRMQARGHDGIVLEDQGHVIVFDPGNIKSAEFNTGEFDRANKDVRYSRQQFEEDFDEDTRDAAKIVKNRTPKNDITALGQIFSTPDYLLNADPAGKRLFETQPERRDRRFELENDIFNKTGENTGFVHEMTKLRKEDPAEYEKAKDYLLKTDKTGEAFRIKQWSGYIVRGLDGNEIDRTEKSEDADTIARKQFETEAARKYIKPLPVGLDRVKRYQVGDRIVDNYDKARVLSRDMARADKTYIASYKTEKIEQWELHDPKKKLVGTFKTEREAVDALEQAEHDYLSGKGFSFKATGGVLAFRRMTNRAFDHQIADLKQIIAECEKLKIDPPTVTVVDESRRWGIFGHGKRVGEFSTRKEAENAVYSLKKTDFAQYKGLEVRRQQDAEIKKETTLQDIMAMMGELRGSYFPRQREEGRVILRATKGESRIMEKFDFYAMDQEYIDPETGVVSAAKVRQASSFIKNLFNRISGRIPFVKTLEKRARQLERDGYKISIERDSSLPETVFDPAGLIASISSLMNEAVDQVKDQELRGAAAQEANKIILNGLAEQFKKRGFLSARIARSDEYWEGFETDPLKAGTQYAKGLAAGIAKRETSQKMVLIITGRDESWDDWKADKEDPQWEDYQEFVRNRAIDPKQQGTLYKEAISFTREMLRNDEQGDRIMGTLRGLATFKFLGFRVSSAAINATNMVQAVPATISAQTGGSIAAALNEIGRAASIYGKYRLGKLTGADQAIMADIHQRGWVEAQFNHEAADALRNKVGNHMDTFLGWSMLMFGAVEKVNRATTIFAAYKQFKKQFPEMDHETAMAKAKHVSDRAHGIYDKSTAPAWSRGANNPVKLLYTFVKFGHNYLLNTAEMIGKDQWKQAGYMILSPAILGGMGASIATKALFLALGLGSDSDDPEEEFYAWVEEKFGSDTLPRHGLAGLLGVNIKGSLQVNNPFPTKITELFGAPGAVIFDAAKGMKHLGRGEFYKAAEDIMPAAVGNVSKAIREHREGVTTDSSTPVYYGMEPLKGTATEAAIRFLSFSPSRISAVREKQWSEKKVAGKFADRKSEIYSRFKRFYLRPPEDQDSGDYAELLKMVDAFNEDVFASGRYDISPITGKSLTSAIKQSMRPGRRERMRESQ
jgi:hypothetical protein